MSHLSNYLLVTTGWAGGILNGNLKTPEMVTVTESCHGNHGTFLLLLSLGDGQGPLLPPFNPNGFRGIDDRRDSLGLAVAAASSDDLRLQQLP